MAGKLSQQMEETESGKEKKDGRQERRTRPERQKVRL